MLILLSNDDGVGAPGLAALREALSALGDVWVVAPMTEQSAKSHSFTMHEPLRIIEQEDRVFGVTGTPADSVYLACHYLLPRRPALVVSGINRGANLSTDVHYSGTVAAAREGVSLGIPAVAVSLYLKGGSGAPRWETARHWAREVAGQVLERGLPPGTLLNVNVPDLPLAQVRGLRVAPMGRRYYHPLVTVGRDPRGKPYYWIGGDHERFSDDPQADGPLCEEGYVTVTPLGMDLTAHALLPRVAGWWETGEGDAS